MLLVIDVGNTNTVFAVFAENRVVGTWRLSTDSKRTADEYAIALKQLMLSENVDFDEIDNVIISCVVPESLFSFKTLTRKCFNSEIMVVGDDGIYLPITVKLEKPLEIGADRLVNAVSAFQKYDGAIIVIDFGTATTFDVITESGDYLGGAIAPGVDLSLDALHMAAAKLPKIAIEKPKRVIGNNTVSAMQSGVYWGYIGLIEGIVGKIKSEYGMPMTVIATGGLAPLYESATDIIEYLEPDLTIEGLNIIFKLNRNKVQNLKEATS